MVKIFLFTEFLIAVRDVQVIHLQHLQEEDMVGMRQSRSQRYE